MKSVSTAFVLCLLAAAGVLADELPTTGAPQPELAEFDAWMQKFLADYKIPGASLAIVEDGKLVYSRGFGWADRETKEQVQPESLFRIASVSKPITAAAIFKLIDQKKLKLDDKVLDHLKYEPHFEKDGKFDERWKQITIEHCLSHTGGWDRDKSYDPMFQAIRMAKSMQIELPILPEHIIRFQLGQLLDFAPGERYAYSNFGYSLLGRIIEKVSGQAYEKYVQQEVLKPLGITRARIGGSLLAERAEGEVKYYHIGDGEGTAVVGPGAGVKKVPIGYGTWRQETLDSHGGWIASAPDLAKFAAAFDETDDNQTRSKLLTIDSVQQMISVYVETAPAAEGRPAKFYGLGWMTEPAPNRRAFIARHGGALPCTAASLMHFPNGVNLAILTNLGQSPDGKFLGRQLEPPLTELVRKKFGE